MKLILPLLLVAWSAGGATYFVDPSNGNDGNNGTAQGTAWKHIPGTVTGGPTTVINNGDTITVIGGSVINASIAIVTSNYNGSASFDSIVIQSGELLPIPWGSGKVVIDGQSVRLYGVGFDGVSGVTLDDFEIRNIASGNNAWGGNGSACVELGANSSIGFSHVSVRRCWLHDSIRLSSADEDHGHGMEADHGSDLLVYYNQVGPGIGTKGCEPFHVQGGSISNNFFSGTGDHPVALSAATNFDVCNNFFLGLSNGFHSTIYSVALPGCKNCDVWNNLCTLKPGGTFPAGPNDPPVGIGLYAEPGIVTIGNRIVYNTIALLRAPNTSGATSPLVFSGNNTGVVSNTLAEANIVFNCTNNFGLSGFVYYFDNGAGFGTTTNLALDFNDIFAVDASQTIAVKHVLGTYNLYAVPAFPVDPNSTYTNNVTVDPLFLGGTIPSGLDSNWRPNTPYFSLGAAPPTSVRATGHIINGDAVHGYNHSVNKFAFDITGLPRINWSMGAYEWSSFPPPPYAVNAIISGRVLITGKVFIQ